MRAIILLSDKSSGSSAVQSEFARHPLIQHVHNTPHNEFETLFWVKAAAVCRLPQSPMRYSKVVPYEQGTARAELVRLVEANVPAFQPPADDQHLVLEGWRSLCEAHAPVFFEKSPHHLHQWSSLELMVQAAEALPDIDFHFIGLVRNPVDTLYSMWSRWRYVPEQRQHEWVRAYANLLRFRDLAGERLRIVRYEEVIASEEVLASLFTHCGLEPPLASGDRLHGEAVQRWRGDTLFGFQPSVEVVELAQAFGYDPDALCPQRTPLWPLSRTVRRAARVSRQTLAQLRR